MRDVGTAGGGGWGGHSARMTARVCRHSERRAQQTVASIHLMKAPVGFHLRFLTGSQQLEGLELHNQLRAKSVTVQGEG